MGVGMGVGMGMGLLVGCAPTPADYGAARAACGLEPGEHAVVAIEEGRLDLSLDATCATWLGEDLGLDWESFGATPGPVAGGEHSQDLVLFGAWQLVAADYGTVDDLLDEDLPSTWGRGALDHLAGRLDLAGSDPAGALLYAWVTTRIDQVVLDPELEGAGAWFHAGTVWVPVMDHPGQAPPAWMASGLVHEAAHADGPAHVPCADGSHPEVGCDPDLDEIYGTQIGVLRAQAAALDPQAPHAAATESELAQDLAMACGMVNTPGADCARLPPTRP